jgi:hypothetical protein
MQRRTVVGVGVSISFVAFLMSGDAGATEGPDDLAGTDLAWSSKAMASAAAGTLLPQTLSPLVSAQRASVAVSSGYDGGHGSATLATVADVQLASFVGLRAGLTYLPNEDVNVFKPHVGLSVQLLRQGRHGIDGALGAFYRMERFSEDDGQIQLIASVARRFGRLATFANVGYGQDPEGDDRDGDVRLAGQVIVSSILQLGVDSHVRFDLFSSDARRLARGTTDLDFAAGPTATLTFDRFALVAQTGVSGVRVETMRTGALATLGFASVF